MIFLTGANAAFHLEEQHRIRSMGHCLVAPQAHHARALKGIEGLPVLLAGGLLHQHKRLIRPHSAHQIMVHGNLADRVLIGRIIVPGNEIHAFPPFHIIQWLVCAHKVRGHRYVRRNFLHGIILQTEAFQNAVRIKPAVIKADALSHRTILINMLAAPVRYHNILPAIHSMSPKRRVPRPVQLF